MIWDVNNAVYAWVDAECQCDISWGLEACVFMVAHSIEAARLQTDTRAGMPTVNK